MGTVLIVPGLQISNCSHFRSDRNSSQRTVGRSRAMLLEQEKKFKLAQEKLARRRGKKVQSASSVMRRVSVFGKKKKVVAPSPYAS